MRPGVSIIIPTHNRAPILARALASLGSLRVPEGTDVEVLVVANACTDGTHDVVDGARRRADVPVRLVEEPVAGSSIARNTGVAHARHDLLASLDDDVWVYPEWLGALLDVCTAHPADGIAGRIELWWDAVERPAWLPPELDRLLSALDHGRDVRELTTPDVYGANCAFTRRLFEAAGPFEPELGRRGRGLVGGEDSLLYRRALERGFRVFYAPRCAVKHWVIPTRATPEYLAGITRAGALGLVLMRDRLDPLYVARTLAAAGVKLVLDGPAAALARLRGDTGARVRREQRTASAIGALEGLLLRARGRSPGIR